MSSSETIAGRRSAKYCKVCGKLILNQGESYGIDPNSVCACPLGFWNARLPVQPQRMTSIELEGAFNCLADEVRKGLKGLHDDLNDRWPSKLFAELASIEEFVRETKASLERIEQWHKNEQVQDLHAFSELAGRIESLMRAAGENFQQLAVLTESVDATARIVARRKPAAGRRKARRSR